MAEPFLGEIRLMSFTFAPKAWALCNGQLLAIAQNTALFSLLGTTFGGDGRVNFGLPDLRGRVPIHVGSSHRLGERAGEESHTLSPPELAQHFHTMQGSATNADVVSPTDNVVAQSSQLYGPATQLVTLDGSTNGNTGGSQPHQNMQPFLTVSFCIALQGIFPSQS